MKKNFDHSIHHPAPEMLKHMASPLSAALFLYTVGTIAKKPSIRAWWTARQILGLWDTVGWRRSSGFALTEALQLSSSSVLLPSGTRAFSTAVANSGSSTARACYRRVGVSNRPFGSSRSWTAVTTSTAAHWNVGPRFIASSSTSPEKANSLIAPGPASEASAISHGQTEGIACSVVEPLSGHNEAVAPELYEKLSQIYPQELISSVASHLTHFPLTSLMDQALTNFHTMTGLPWWASIAIMTCIIRLPILPLNISFMRHQLRVKRIQPWLSNQYSQMKAAKTPEEARSKAQETLSLLSSIKARPLVAWWTPVAFPIYFLSWFTAVHNQCLSNPELLTGGTLWFTDLIASDSTFLLPVAACLSWLGIIEMGASALYLQRAPLKMWTRFTGLALIPVLSTLPSGVFCFWISSNIWEIARIHLFNRDDVRRVFGIPQRSEMPPVTPVAW